MLWPRAISLVVAARVGVDEDPTDDGAQGEGPGGPATGHGEAVHGGVRHRARGVGVCRQVGRRRRGGHGIEQCRPDRGADLLRGVGGGRGDADVTWLGLVGGGADAGHQRDPQAEAEQDLGRQDVADIGGVGRELGQQRHPHRGDQQPRHDQPTGPHVGHQATGQLGGGQSVDRHERQEGDTRLEWGIAVDRLQQIGEEEERAVHPEHGQDDGEERPGPVPVGQNAHRQQGAGHLGLHQHEQGQQDHGDDEGPDDQG